MAGASGFFPVQLRDDFERRARRYTHALGGRGRGLPVLDRSGVLRPAPNAAVRQRHISIRGPSDMARLSARLSFVGSILAGLTLLAPLGVAHAQTKIAGGNAPRL